MKLHYFIDLIDSNLKKSLNYSIFFLDGILYNNTKFNIEYLYYKSREKKGIIANYDEVISISKGFKQMFEVTLIMHDGQKIELNKKSNNLITSIELVDTSFWEIESEDLQYIRKLKTLE